jgi:hypothetical protein
LVGLEGPPRSGRFPVRLPCLQAYTLSEENDFYEDEEDLGDFFRMLAGDMGSDSEED